MKKRIQLADGNGMQATHELIREVFIKRFSNRSLNTLSDAADIGRYAFSCDSFTVNPLFFPSSDIGKLAVFGTVNDLCVSAARPLYISLAVIVEEGFPKKDLERVSDSVQEASRAAGVKIVCGDFKVVGKKAVDRIFLITSGIGKKIPHRCSHIGAIRKNDKVIITGGIAEHGITVMLSRNGIFDFTVESDCQSLRDVLIPLWEQFSSIRFMRDPTRGGIAGVLNEVALSAGLGIILEEERIPVRRDVAAACELLGIDPYYLACEGRAIIITEGRLARSVLRQLHGQGQKEACIIGEVTEKTRGVVVHTVAGGARTIDFSYSMTLPRIC